ncbi:MAG TPA: IclR family transcriptional regulator C-terminal domain-containing protein [Marmoricola sp.]|nr:IclR family transcriptional regulator C-terminal domain-containing protein [Marmoricola sp.]
MVSQPHQTSFSRGLDVLIAVARNGEASVPELANELDLPQSTVYRYIRSLRDYALVEESQGVYVPGWRLMDIAGHHLTYTKLAELGGEFLRTLTYQTSETAVLAVRAGSHAICLRQSVSPLADRHAFRINQLLPLHAGAGSRVLLAYAPRAIVDITLSHLTRYSDNTPSPERLLELLARTRREGFTLSLGEFQEGAVAVAVPVFAAAELVCSLTVAGPRERCDNDEWKRRALRLLRSAADELATALAD